MRPKSVHSRPSALRHIAGFTLLAASLALIGCGDDEKSPVAPGGGTPTTSSFIGFVSDGVMSGKLTITVNSTSLTGGLRAGAKHAASVTASGIIKTATGATTSLSGTYDSDLDSLHLAGTGWTLIGDLLSDGGDDTMLGRATGPNGLGFFLTANLANSVLSIYTGKYYSQAFGDSGTWDMATYSDTVFIATYAPGDTEPTYLNGLLTGSAPTRTVTAYGGSPATFDRNVTGTINATNGAAAGTWTFTYNDPAYYPDDNGSWNGVLIP